MTHGDGVHLTNEGYVKLAKILKSAILEQFTASVVSSGRAAAPRCSFYWRGFTSPVGSERAKTNAATYKQARIGSGKWRHAPYPRPSHQSMPGRGRGGPYRGNKHPR